MPAKKKVAGGEKKQRNSAGAVARGKAVQRLIEAYPEAWGQFLREEREAAGLSAEVGRMSRLQKLAQRMLQAGVDPAELNEALQEAGYKAKV